MARQTSVISSGNVPEKYNTPLAQNLRALIEDTSALKEYLNISLQAVNQYKTGESRPSYENLCKIADYYNVTTDYLLGRTNARTTDIDIAGAVELLGLSQEAVEVIMFDKRFKKAKDAFSIEDLLIKERFLSYWARIVREYVKNAALVTELESRLGAGFVEDKRNYFKWRAIQKFESSLQEAFEEYAKLYTNEQQEQDKKVYLAEQKNEFEKYLQRIEQLQNNGG